MEGRTKLEKRLLKEWKKNMQENEAREDGVHECNGGLENEVQEDGTQVDEAREYKTEEGGANGYGAHDDGDQEDEVQGNGVQVDEARETVAQENGTEGDGAQECRAQDDGTEVDGVNGFGT